MSMSLTRWYLRHYTDPHLCLKGLSHAARLSSSVVMLKTPMPVPFTVEGPALIKSVNAIFWKLAAHVFLVMRVLRTKERIAVVREFLTVPLLLCSPLLLGARKRVWFLVNHNLNNTLARPIERFALRLLSRLGFRFIVYEDTHPWEIAGIGPAGQAHVRAILLPVFGTDACSVNRAGRAGRPVTIGFIGNYRKEKSPEWALRAISEALASRASGFTNCTLLIGTPDATFRADWAGMALVRDTTDYADFTQALRDCDVVVFPYSRDSYFFRVSGVVAEAVVCGSTVLVPDFPLLKHQVEFPATVGYCYSGAANFLPQLRVAVQASRSVAADVARSTYLQSRGVGGSMAFFNSLPFDGT